MRFAESAARWLERREPKAWLTLAIFVRSDDGKHTVLPREQAVSLLEKARAHAVATDRAELARELSTGLDLVKAAAPVEVPLIVFLEAEGGEVSFGVLTLALPPSNRGKKSVQTR